jgi:hypothetical protein
MALIAALSISFRLQAASVRVVDQRVWFLFQV